MSGRAAYHGRITETEGDIAVDVMEAVRTRCSIREYQDRSVPEDKLLKVLEAARLAPSASNRQRCKFIVVRDAERRRRLSAAAGGQKHLAGAPVVIAIVSTFHEYHMRCGVPAYAVDVGIAGDHITLAAIEQGLGTCWIGAFSQEEARAALEVPAEHKVAALMPLGFPAAPGRPKTRKPLDEVVCYETFRE